MRTFCGIVLLVSCAGFPNAQAPAPADARAGSSLMFMLAGATLPQPSGLRRDWAAESRRMLQENVPKFWVDHAVDREYGEWYASIAADGRINAEKAGPWKAPYHVTRALLEVVSRLGRTL